MLEQMKVGSIIIDLASEFGGNCQLTKHNAEVIHKSVRIVGPLNLAATVSQDSSRLFSKNVLNFLMNSCEDGKFKKFNFNDELVKRDMYNKKFKIGFLNGNIDPIINLLMIFILACIIGYYVIWGVTSALHSPLMAVTNAIS